MNNPLLLLWSSASRTEVGKVRKVNEDACLDLPEIGLWAVADGMGGHAAGDLASRMIVEELQQLDAPESLSDFIDKVSSRLLAVNAALRAESARRDRRTIGSTVVVLVAFAYECACIWAGDSRIYRVRGGEMVRLTDDHSLVEEYVTRGILRREDAESSPQANVITRAVGVVEDLELDTRAYALNAGDTFLLCSDGLYKELSEPEIARCIATGGSDHQTIVDTLTETALSRGARDNLTTVLVTIRDGLEGESAAEPGPAAKL